MLRLLDCSALPEDDSSAELANDVALIQSANVRRDVIGLRQVEVDVLVSHAVEHHFYSDY